MEVGFAITSADTAAGLGAISGVEVQEASFEAVHFEACVLDALDQLQFDPPPDEGGVEVIYPLIFSTE